MQSYQDVNGSPFLVNKFVQGDVKFTNGKIAKNIAIMYDQVLDAVIFKGKNNEDYYFTDKIAEFIIDYNNLNGEQKSIFRNGFAVDKNLTDQSFFQVLIDGKIKLLKRNQKTITSTKEYNSATVVKNINEAVTYYITKDNVPLALKRLDNKSLMSLFDAQYASKIADYLTSNKLNLKSEIDLINVIQYYNTLIN